MNRKHIFKWQYLLIPVYIFLTGCPPEPTPKKEKPSYNILILLDLSDRLVTNENQADRDKQFINYICNKIPDIIIKNNGVKRSKESIKIIIADQDNIPYPTTQFSDSLFFKMSKDIRGGIPAVRKILKERFPRNLDKLFKSAVFSDNPADYHGANISRYFTRDLSTDIKRDSLSNNLLFIFTDGYLNVGNNPNLMMDVHDKFPELKVMVLEMTPKNRDYESERLQQKWDQWFADMSIEGYALRNIGPTQAIIEDIDKFLAGSLELTVPGKKNEQVIERVQPHVKDNKTIGKSTTKSITPPPPPPPNYDLTANSVEEYFKKIADPKIPYTPKAKLKKEIIERYFENENSQVIELGKKNRTLVGRKNIKDYVEELSQQYYEIEIVRKNENSNNKITTLYIVEL